MATDSVEAFCRAVWRHDDKVIAALGRKVDPNASDRFGYTPLRMAAQYGDLPLVKLLVERGAELDQGRRHLTPITFAARRKAHEIVAFLRERGATVSMVTSIHLADVQRIERELDRDPGLVRLEDEDGTPILHHAAEALEPELVAVLLDRGATVADVDRNGETALHRVADLRQAAPDAARAVATLLLDRGAAPDARNWDDVTPLHQAVRARNLAMGTDEAAQRPLIRTVFPRTSA